MLSTQAKVTDASAWRAQLIRLTAFPLDPSAEFERDWWTEVIGAPAEQSTRKKLIRTDEGQIDGASGILTLTRDVLRIDWSFGAAIDPSDPPEGIPDMGPLPDAIKSCELVFKKFLDCGMPLRRLAFGTTLFLPCKDHADSYTRLGSFLPYVQIDPESRDFQYRINRLRDSATGIDSLRINRLSHWSATRWKSLIKTTTPEEVVIQHSSSEVFACKLELDVNTTPEFPGTIPRDQSRRIWDELVDMGLEIASKGDVP